MLSTYENGHKILNDIRLDLNEHSTARLQGTSTSGAFDNDWIMRNVNRAQRRIYALLVKSMPSHFLSYATMAFSSSEASLPWDFGRVVELKDELSRKVHSSSIKVLPTTTGAGSDSLYYRKGNTLVLNKSSVTENYTLWYLTKPRDIIQGLCATENTITSGKLIADYYNGLTLESITGGWVDTITDYTAAQVATFSSKTLDIADYYGTVSEIPELFHPFISPLASMICRSTHPRTQKSVSKAEFELWQGELQDTLNVFGNDTDDVSIEEIFTDYATGEGGLLTGDMFPGASYPY